jgi:hypothetical protein
MIKIAVAMTRLSGLPVRGYGRSSPLTLVRMENKGCWVLRIRLPEETIPGYRCLPDRFSSGVPGKGTENGGRNGVEPAAK